METEKKQFNFMALFANISFQTWLKTTLARSLHNRKNPEWYHLGLFQALVAKDLDEIVIIKDVLLNFAPQYMSSKRQIKVDKICYYENTNIRALAIEEGILYPFVMPTDAELIKRSNLPLTINIWRFHNETLNDIRIYGKHHQSHAINILLMKTGEEGILLNHHIQHSDSPYDIYELKEVPVSSDVFANNKL